MSNEQSDAKIIPFPPASGRADRARAECSVGHRHPAVVDHDGHSYALEALLRQLPPHCLREVEATAPRSGQELWDEVVRRWPGTAAEVVAGVVRIE